MTTTVPESDVACVVADRRLKVSIIIEWANTQFNGIPRATVLLAILGRQWQAIQCREYPESLATEARQFLDRLTPDLQVLVVSASTVNSAIEEDIRRSLPASLSLAFHVAPGLEYYGLKNFGAQRANGELLMFVDSDVEPEDDWLAHLLGTFCDDTKQVVCGQTYIPPTSLYATAFALGWTYDLRDPLGRVIEPVKYYANNIAFRAEVFRQTGFASLGRRSRGASTLLRRELDSRGIKIWENRSARVGHPPPATFQHLVIRALAHGRDHYMKHTEGRTLNGLGRSVGIAGRRQLRGVIRTFRYRREVRLRVWQVPIVLTIITCYYAFFGLGGLLTHISPRAMGRHFRV